jgi:hypothetical protein
MIEIPCFMAADQLDNADPKPGRRVKALRSVSLQVSKPIFARVPVHLSPVRFANYIG